MSYRRGGVNVSQYLRNLNVQEPALEETFVTDDDLALFTNTEFFDFETGQNTDYQAPPVKPDTTTQSTPVDDVAPTDPLLTDFSTNIEFMQGDFNFGDFGSNYTSPTIPSFPESLGNLQPIQPNPQTAYPPPVSQHQPGTSQRILSFEEASRLAAEEDKRKRNTAASARFRIKKKQREQALEKSAKEMADKVTMLEGRISALETENKWLKSLVTEKHGGKDDILKKLLKEFAAQESKGPASSTGSSDEDESSITASGSTIAADESDSKRSKKN
ncbi:putative regulatory protein cys-3 [Echria macrotheca]|uniref:Regulatory protein cys-3 n=1 Tax=Echria macrotheca TaxID=438768 RepID=A0AAJ0FAE3_9PEZI|nr:putative regulatory protein cys-3 [Echria macrotheca]